MSFTEAEKAEAAVIGHVMMLSITIIGISTITLYGVPAISSLENTANVKAVEQSFNFFDSGASQVVIGGSLQQTATINLGGGTLTVEPNSTKTMSYMTVKSSNFNITISMGRITYTLGDRIVAYEGGGIWSKYPSGKSEMLSPPELYFNGVTLSLPAINISGNASVGGGGIATISFKKNDAVVLYPNTTTSTNWTNPITISAGKVYVNITSDFYTAWADYAEGLGYAIVSKNPATHTTSLELSVVPNNLGNDIPIANPVVFMGLNESDDTPLDNFSFELEPFGDKFDWDIRASSGKKKLIFHIKGDAKEAGKEVDLNIGYQDDGLGLNKPAETWEGKDKLITQQDGGGVYLALDMLNNSLNLTYKKKNVGAEASCSPDKIQDGKFNETGFSWNLTQQAAQTTKYKWGFNTSTEWNSWGKNATSPVGWSRIYDDGVGTPLGSASVGTSNTNVYSTTTYTSPAFYWGNGTPTSARLDFDWELYDYNRANPGSFYVMLVKPDLAESQIYPTTQYNATTPTSWSSYSNTTVSATDFTSPGNYKLKLVAILSTQGSGSPHLEVRWDNPKITLDSNVVSGGSLTNKSLYDITQHYFNIMAKAGNGTITFYQCSPSGKQAPDSDSTMLMDYFTPGGLTYMQISENRVTAGVS